MPFLYANITLCAVCTFNKILTPSSAYVNLGKTLQKERKGSEHNKHNEMTAFKLKMMKANEAKHLKKTNRQYRQLSVRSNYLHNPVLSLK